MSEYTRYRSSGAPCTTCQKQIVAGEECLKDVETSMLYCTRECWDLGHPDTSTPLGVLKAAVLAEKVIMSLSRDYLHSIPGFVMAYGLPFKPGKRPWFVPKGRPRQCFNNCCSVVTRRSHLVYVEGYAILKDIPMPIHHAWIAQAGELVAIDPTVSDFVAYFGVPFEFDFASKLWLASKMPSLLDDWRHHWPLLKIPDDEIRTKAIHPCFRQFYDSYPSP